MDTEIRGYIERYIDNVLKLDILPEIAWVGNVIPLRSLENTVLGYALGVMKASIYYMLVPIFGQRLIPNEAKEEVDRILQRRIPEIRDKILAEIHR